MAAESKALVTGASGLLGRQVLRAFQRAAGWTATGTGLTRTSPPSILKLDLCDEAEVAKTLDHVKPHVVVHCAANRSPDSVDANPDAARALNVASSATLAAATSSRAILLIYISTDYVFSGAPGEAPYAADAATGPSNLYGQTKLEGERAVLDATSASKLGLVLRVPVLYGAASENKESAVNVLMDAVWKAQDQDVLMDDWAIRYPTNTEDVGRVCVDLARYYLLGSSSSSSSKHQVVQFSSEDRITKYGICQILAEIMGLSLDRMQPNKQGNDPNAKVQRPYDCHLSTAELKQLGINVQTQDFKAWWRREARAFRK